MKYFICILVVLFSSYSVGQSYKVYVVDEEDKAIPFVSVEITFTKNDSVKKIQLTTLESGIIQIDSTWKKVRLKLRHISYQSKFTSVSKENNKVNMYLDRTGLTTFVVTGQYTEGSAANSVHKVKVINRQRIEAQGAVNLQELMEQEMNVSVSQDQFLGSAMSIQGLSGENVKILIDGVPVVGRLNGNVDLSQINLDNIEQVEIVEGPLSVNYGTNALAGTINLISKKNQKKTSGSIQSYGETVGQINVSGNLNLVHNTHLLNLHGGRNFFNGFSIEDTSRVDLWKPKTQYMAGFGYSNTIKNFSYRLSSDFFSEELVTRGEPRKPYQETAFDDYFRTKRISSTLNLNYTFNSNSRISVLGGYNYYNRIKNRYLKDLVNIEYQLVDDQSQQDTSVFDLIFSRGTYSYSKDSSKINYQLGYDINIESNKGERISGGTKEIGDYAVFGSLEYHPTSRLVIRPGLRYVYNKAYKSPLIPSLNMKYVFTKHMTGRFSWGKGFRAPSLKELHFLFVDINHNIKGNESLIPENSDNLMMSIQYKRGIKRGVYHFDLNGFYNAISNQIGLVQLDQTGQLFTYSNIGKFYSQGLNFSSGFRYKTYKTDFGLSWIGRYNIEYESTPGLKKFFYTPEILTSFGYEVETWQTTFNLFFKRTGRLLNYAINDENEIYQFEIAPFNMLDFSVIKYLYKKKLNFTLGAKNIFDVTAIQTSQSTGGGVHSSGSSSLSVGWGRTYFLKIALSL